MNSPPALLVLVGFVLTCYQITCLHIFSSVLSFLQRCPCENNVLFVFTPICYVGSCFIYVICIYLRKLVSNAISISDDVRVV
jgi:hypothetical protein